MITKSNFVVGHECQRCFWFAYKGFKDPNIDEERLKDGKFVGEQVKKIFPKGIEIPFLGNDYMEMHRLTIDAIVRGEEVIFEGSFLVNDVFIRVDVMQKSSSGWDIFEVKSSSDIKTIHKEDVSIQWYILSQIKEIILRDIYLITLDKDYRREKDLDLKKVFKKHPALTEYANNNIEEISKILKKLKKISELKEPPKERIGGSVKKKYKCSLKDHCWPDNINKKNSVFKLFNMRSKKKFYLYSQGIDTFEKIKDLENFSKIQQVQVNSTINNSEFTDKEIIKNFISKVSYPISFLDFETYSEPIPKYYGQKPNGKIPFQYSLHIQDAQCLSVDSDITHYEFLGDHRKDPRRDIAGSLIKNIPKEGSIITYYQPFEKGVIKNLADFFPELSNELLDFNNRILDLMEPFSKGGYYHPEFEGSFSIKKVLPALCKNNEKLDYKNLKISNGGMASSAFRNLKEKTDEQIIEIRRDLVEYCYLDTYAMYAIFNKLLTIIDI